MTYIIFSLDVGSSLSDIKGACSVKDQFLRDSGNFLACHFVTIEVKGNISYGDLDNNLRPLLRQFGHGKLGYILRVGMLVWICIDERHILIGCWSVLRKTKRCYWSRVVWVLMKWRQVCIIDDEELTTLEINH